MKKNFLKSVLITLLLWAGNFANNEALSGNMVQTAANTPNYWVVETNLKHRDYSIVRFYNGKNELLYEEKLNGIYLNISRPRHVKRLNCALQQITNKPWPGVKPENLVVSLFNRKL